VLRMQTATEAEEHLRVIRSLMEKATIYRAVSAPTALAGAIARLSGALRMAQTGYVRSYALSMLAGAALVVAAILAVRLW